MSESNETPENTLFENDASSALRIPALQPPPSQVQAASFESGTSDTAMENQPPAITTSQQRKEVLVAQESVSPGNIKAAACECGGTAPPQLVFALGNSAMTLEPRSAATPSCSCMRLPANSDDPLQLLSYLKENPWDGAAILWTLNLDATPIYALQAQVDSQARPTNGWVSFSVSRPGRSRTGLDSRL
jgi:hypothetical protein